LKQKGNQHHRSKQVAERWLEIPHDWKTSTRRSYRHELKNHLCPVLGKKPMRDITLKDLRLLFDGLYSEGLALPTLRLVRAPLAGVFSYAMETEIIKRNPVRDLTLKYKKKPFEIVPLDEKESIAFLEQAKNHLEGKYYPALLCALRTGMRVGELQALEWGNIDFEERTIEVSKSWRRDGLTRTKNKKRRRIDMSPLLAGVLKDHRTAQKRRAIKKGKPFPVRVFAPVGKDLMGRTAFKETIDACCSGAGISRKIRTHDLRHSYATIRLLRGHNIGDVSYQLGHSSIKITYDVYVHWIPGTFKSEVDDLDNVKPDTLQNDAMVALGLQNEAKKGRLSKLKSYYFSILRSILEQNV
jgi:integrase